MRGALMTPRAEIIAWGLGAVAAILSLVIVPGATGAFGAVLGVLMARIAVIDSRQFIIPDRLNLLAGAAGMMWWALLSPDGGALFALARGLLLAGGLWCLRALYRRYRQRTGLGLGDVKLAFVCGIWLNWDAAILSIEAAAVSALLFVGFLALHSGSRIAVTRRIPFGLFLAPALWGMWMLDANGADFLLPGMLP